MADLTADLKGSLMRGDHIRTEELTKALVDAGTSPSVILDSALLPAMKVVGQQFRDGELFLPDVLIRARAMKSAMAVLEPLLARSDYAARGKVLLGTVKGDVHDIGKNLVGVMLRGAGYEVIDLGVGCTDQEILSAIRIHRPDIVGLSALLTTTMSYMKTIITTVRESGESLPIIVGGAPVNAGFAESIGATGTARTAPDAVDLVSSVLKS